ncbi:MAG: methyltransferase domain-containing protein [Verrucomicrobia bacterium]|nr:methyltransferase domain-containing protein [Verrucomicrobiota bacterium]MBU1733929.1 methyltransferase domain-containing protein [Verrucomicrobiota bacterium]MBU1857283.1 methyltransferase domain-containing protein [Verrucomicrobiota bacterium]
MTFSSHSRFDFGELASRYDSWYETDEGRRHDAAQKQAVLALLPKHATGGRCLLDVGCGTGHWSLFFAQQDYEVTGVDICPEMIAAAQACKALHCRFDVADAMNLPFLDKSFDVVSAMAMLEFISDTRRVCAEMIRCLKPGGRLVLGTLNRLAEINQRRVAEQAEPYVSAQMFAPEELCKLLMLFGNVTIRVTMEEMAVQRQASDGPAPVKHGLDDRNESGAFIVAMVVKP